jgi:hypothetical protein
MLIVFGKNLAVYEAIRGRTTYDKILDKEISFFGRLTIVIKYLLITRNHDSSEGYSCESLLRQ